MLGRWGPWERTESVALPRWVVVIIISGVVGVVGLTGWGGLNTGLVVQQLKNLAETVERLARADEKAHTQMQRNSREIAEIRGRLAMTALGRPMTAAGVATGRSGSSAGGRQ